MSVTTSPADVLTTIARALTAAQKYASVEDALRGMAVAEVRRKIAYYQRRIRTLEHKHSADFDTFSARLSGRATPAEEDDWLAWRSACRMLDDWKETYAELAGGRSRH